MASPTYDLASLAKPLVTAPLALGYLDLDADRRWSLGFTDRAEPLTVRQLLSHSAGLTPWRPFTGEPVAAQLRRPVGADPLLRDARVGESTYSDLGYRLLAELLEAELGLSWRELGAAGSGLSPWPWQPAPVDLPPGRDREAWAAATGVSFPEPRSGEPHDANARAGMRGHAGFAATRPQFERALRIWAGAGWPRRMAVPTAKTAEGQVWGLGLLNAQRGAGRYAELLRRIPEGIGGVHVGVDAGAEAAPTAPALQGPPGEVTDWWFHTGYTGPLLCVRPSDGCVVALLLHRRGPGGELLSEEALRGRRWGLLARVADTLLG
ncbi:MAG TPA: serine hydrolase domain-containing protein [Holophagaceae bacterium]|nr:serine hydrolase domain-containing protein [Holophagaceae bacterium]